MSNELAVEILDKKIDELQERMKLLPPFSEEIQDIQCEIDCYLLHRRQLLEGGIE